MLEQGRCDERPEDRSAGRHEDEASRGCGSSKTINLFDASGLQSLRWKDPYIPASDDGFPASSRLRSRVAWPERIGFNEASQLVGEPCRDTRPDVPSVVMPYPDESRAWSGKVACLMEPAVWWQRSR